MKGIKSQKGQALILIAFGIVALIGFTALAVDGGRVFSDRRNAQNAADTSALAAALEYIQQENKTTAKTKGVDRAASNGYATDTDSTVTVEFCDEAADKCQDPEKKELSLSDKPAEFIRVTITSDVPMTFGRVLGRDLVTNRVVAIARVQGTTTTSLFNAGAGLYSVKGGNNNDCFKVLGNANLTLHNTGIFVNCEGDNALSFGGSADIYMDANARVVGCSDDQDFPINGTGKIDCYADPQIVTKSTFADVPTTLPTPNCTTNGYKVGNTWYPGNYGPENISSTVIFSPGTFCFPNGLSVKSGGNLTGSGGTVKLVLSHDIDLKGSGNDFDDLEIYMDDADFEIFGSLVADRLRFFGNGSSSISLKSHAVLTSGDAYIYSEAGEIDFNAQANANLAAPPQGDPFGGLLMYMPWDNPNDFELNGGTGNTWKGTILMPSADVTYNGGSDFELHGQVIAYTFKINGGSEGDIYFNSDVIFNPPNNPTIEFTK